MLDIRFVEKDATPVHENKLFTARYGDMDIVDVRAKSEFDAEEKFLFALVSNLRGRTLDFNPEKL